MAVAHTDQEDAELIALYESCGQGHVFKYWSTLTDTQKVSLRRSLRELDVVRLGKVFAATLSDSKSGKVRVEHYSA